MSSRLVSLLPSITESLCALGAQDDLVGITHECDYPPSVRIKAVVTASPLSQPGLSSREIDTRVKEHFQPETEIAQQETGLYALRAEVLAKLQPEIIFTQRLCDVCAVSYAQVEQVAAQLKPVPRLISLEPTRLAHLLEDLRTIGAAIGREAQAESLIADLEQRIAQVQQRLSQALTRPRVFCLEWLDPIFASGHWLPELVQLAGGTGFGPAPGEPSRQVAWETVCEFDPEVLLVLPCGFDIARSLQEMHLLSQRPGWAGLSAVRQGQVYVTDGNAYFNRPGPRLVDSLEILATVLHPQQCADLAPEGSFQRFSEHSS